MPSISSSPSKTLSPHRKRKASDDFIEWWFANQQKQMNFEDPNLQYSSSGQEIPASSIALTNSNERLRSRSASKGVKRIFYLESDSTSSTASSFTASLTFRSNSLTRKRGGTQPNNRDVEKPAAFYGPSTPDPDTKLTSDLTPASDMKNHSRQDTSASQIVDTLLQRLEKISIAKGNPPSDADCEISMSSRNTSPVPEWPKEASNPVFYHVLSPSIRNEVPNLSLSQA